MDFRKKAFSHLLLLKHQTLPRHSLAAGVAATVVWLFKCRVVIRTGSTYSSKWSCSFSRVLRWSGILLYFVIVSPKGVQEKITFCVCAGSVTCGVSENHFHEWVLTADGRQWFQGRKSTMYESEIETERMQTGKYFSLGQQINTEKAMHHSVAYMRSGEKDLW